MQLRTLTIFQPWASAIMLGLKKFETRGWELKSFGPLAIHAGLAADVEFESVFGSGLIRAAFAERGVYHWTDLPRGAVLGVVQVTGCWKVETVRDGAPPLERKLGDFRDGRFAIECDRPLIFDKPVPQRGAQRFLNWTVPNFLEETVKDWMQENICAR